MARFCEKRDGYKYHPEKIEQAFIAEIDGIRTVLSTDIKEGDEVVRMVDTPTETFWINGTCHRKQRGGHHVIFRGMISVGETKTQIWYKKVAEL